MAKKKTKTEKKPTTDAAQILHRRYFEGQPKRQALLEEAEREAEK